MTQILQAGAAGYLLKDSADVDLLQAVSAISEGKSFFSPSIARLMLDDGEGTVRGVETLEGRRFGAGAVVITTGTFLRGRIHIGTGTRIAGGNVWEGARANEYPNKPLIMSQAGLIFTKATKEPRKLSTVSSRRGKPALKPGLYWPPQSAATSPSDHTVSPRTRSDSASRRRTIRKREPDTSTSAGRGRPLY